MTNFWTMSVALAGLSMAVPGVGPQTLEQCRAKARAELADYNQRVCAHVSSRLGARRACEDRAADVYLHAVDNCVRDDNLRRAREAAQPRR